MVILGKLAVKRLKLSINASSLNMSIFLDYTVKLDSLLLANAFTPIVRQLEGMVRSPSLHWLNALLYTAISVSGKTTEDSCVQLSKDIAATDDI